MNETNHSIAIDAETCVGCVDCCKSCPTKAIRVRDGCAIVDPETCIDCGTCIRVCRHDAARAKTSSPADLERFQYTVAIPSLTLYAQFGKDVHPGQVLHALGRVGFDSTYDISWMCEMLGGATDAYLSECEGPWPKISITCPAIVRLIQIRYPDLIPNLVPVETARELTAKRLRRKLAGDLGLAPDAIGIFFVTPCSAIMNSILAPVGLEQSYLDGAFSIRELYGPLLQAIKESGEVERTDLVSDAGLRWAMAGGELSGMRTANCMTVSGVQDVQYVFDHIEAGKFQSVDFIEAYICPDGCVSGQLVAEGRYAAQRNIQQICKRLGTQRHVNDEKVRELLRDHFFDIEGQITAREVHALPRDLRAAIALKREEDALRERLPGRDCAACGAPDCATHARDVARGQAELDRCVFVALEQLHSELDNLRGGRHE